jgi:hypothetical protein
MFSGKSMAEYQDEAQIFTAGIWIIIQLHSRSITLIGKAIMLKNGV